MASMSRTSAEAVKNKYLTFSLEDEVYGLEILKVKEIIGIMDITQVPHSPPHVKGVLNLRGKIIPVVDLRLKFNFVEHEYTERTCVIVVELGSSEPKMLIGIIVDAVLEVTSILDSEIESTPQFASQFATKDIHGIARLKGNVVILLDITRVLLSDGLEQFVEG